MIRRRPTMVSVLLAPISVILLASVLSCGPQTTRSEIKMAREYFPAATRVQETSISETGSSQDPPKVIEGQSGVLGYIVDKQVVSRSGPFKIRIVMDSTFHVVRAKVLEYAGARGGAVQRATFTRQFKGKGPGDPIRIGKDIDAITGASISSRVMAEGVRLAVRQVRERFSGTR